MMLFWIWVIMLIAGLAVFRYCNQKHVCYNFLEFLWILLVVLGIFGTVLGGIGIIIEREDAYNTIAVMEAEYESLVVQYESDSYANSSDRYKLNLLEDIRDWNDNLARNKAHQNSFWFGIYTPDIYDHFEFIELK